LLVVLKRLPDTSEFKTAIRDGGFTHDQDVAAKTHNLIGKLTASYLSAHGVEGEDALYYPVLSPTELAERIAEQTDPEDVEQDLITSLFG
jgi:hypothetical protein